MKSPMKRREFLQTVSAAGATPLLAGTARAAADPAEPLPRVDPSHDSTAKHPEWLG